MAHSISPIADFWEFPLVKGVGRLFSRIVTALKHRREVARLVDLDERMLKDIGLTRADVAGALTRPLHHNPSTALAERARDRRSTRKGPAPSERPRVAMVGAGGRRT